MSDDDRDERPPTASEPRRETTPTESPAPHPARGEDDVEQPDSDDPAPPKEPPLDAMRDGAAAWWHKWARALSDVLALIALAAFTVFLLLAKTHTGGAWRWWALGLSAALAPIWFLIRVNSARVRATVTLSERSTTVDSTALVKDAYRKAFATYSRYSEGTFSLLSDMLAEPLTYRRRLIEKVELDRRRAKKSVQMHLTISPDQLSKVPVGDPVLAPLIQPKKGRLYDRLTVREDSGRPVRSLPHDDAESVYLATLLMLYRQTFGLSAQTNEWGEDYRDRFLAMITLTLQSAAELKRRSMLLAPNVKNRRAGVEEAREKLKELLEAADAVDENTFKILRRTATIGLSNYFVIVEGPRSEHLDLSYEYFFPTDSVHRSADKTESSRLTRILQQVFNIPSGWIVVTMGRAMHANSYHLYIDVPEASYFGPTYVTADDLPVQINVRPTMSVGIPYLRPVEMAGSSAHVYARSLGRLTPQPALALHTRVCERPYGTELFACLASISMLLMTIVLGRLAADPTPDTDLIVTLLAFPATLAGLSVFFASSLRRSLIVSTGGAGLTFLSTILSSVWIACFALEITARPGSGASGGWNVFWTAAIVVSWLVTVTATCAVVIRTLRYRKARPLPKKRR